MCTKVTGLSHQNKIESRNYGIYSSRDLDSGRKIKVKCIVTKANEPKTLMLLEEYFSRMLARGKILDSLQNLTSK